jgi:hypothetical protein
VSVWTKVAAVAIKTASSTANTAMLSMLGLTLGLALPLLASAEVFRIQLKPVEDYDPRGRKHAEFLGTSEQGDVPLMNFMDAQV